MNFSLSTKEVRVFCSRLIVFFVPLQPTKNYARGQVMTKEEQRETKNRIAYMVMMVRDFGDAHQLTPRQAHNYLRRHKATDYIQEFYDVEHTLSPEDTLKSLDIISKRNGGKA